MFNLLTIQELDNPPKDAKLYPIIDTDGGILLDDDENVVWQHRVNPARMTRKSTGLLWKLQDVDVTITNKRLIYTCKKFKKGSTWFGLGAGELVAGAFMIASHIKAAAQRRGKVATGHVRYEWVGGLSQNVSWAGGSLSVIMMDSSATLTLALYAMSKQTIAEMTDALLQQVANYKVDNMLAISPSGKARDEAIANMTKVDGQRVYGKTTTTTYTLTEGTLRVPNLEKRV
jgi:hypothetical protein